MSILFGGALLAGALASSAAAEDFYRGKTVNLLIGHEAGGEYDTDARLVARHIGKHIPGNPTVVPQNMSGASGMRVTNFVYNSAPRDGTTIGMMAENLLLNQAFGEKGIQFDARRLNWIGSMNHTSEIVITRASSGVRTLDAARKREVVIGTSTKLTIHYVMTTLANTFLGTKFRIVTGYKGGTSMNMAMERGETDGRVIAWSALKHDQPEWIADKKVNILVQMGPKADDLSEVPRMERLVKSADDRRMIALFTSANRLGRPLATTPETPAERVHVLRAAFEATMKDPAFLKDAQKLHIEVSPVPGVALQEETDRVLSMPAAIVARAKAIME
ncbi:MAG TPA: tripartite tricarboxylate transporter substrate-binding protein [Alphaproteobacteria bacterium]|nr:tripartite tricarboxylate transporter substrate-binding protein [Alphaproteobacteria bacterium]